MKRFPFIYILILFVFLANIIGGLPIGMGDDIVLPKPGEMVPLSPNFKPPVLKGIKVHPDKPFQFEFILDKGDDKNFLPTSLRDESSRLIKYFLASLTIPENDLWVNLSPYEKNRIITPAFGLTEMGRDLLAQDYLLKQISASLMHPEQELGKKFWSKIYKLAENKFGTSDIAVSTFNKVWIVPQKAVVYENDTTTTAYVVESRLKVMLEDDYLAGEKNIIKNQHAQQKINWDKSNSFLSSQVIREIIIPELNREVNEGQNFSQLRQIYNSLILASWYKKKIKDSLLAVIYDDQNKVEGVRFASGINKNKKEKIDTALIYKRYCEAFKKGVFNFIKESVNPITHQEIPRKYFSGGATFTRLINNNLTTSKKRPYPSNEAMSVKVNLEGVDFQGMDPDLIQRILNWGTAESAYHGDNEYAGYDARINTIEVMTNRELEMAFKSFIVQVNRKKLTKNLIFSNFLNG